MRNQIKTILAITIAAASSTAMATPTLRLSDGTHTLVIADGSSLDSSAAAGVVSYTGGLGCQTALNIIAGITKPTDGSATNPRMTLNGLILNGSTGTLTIDFSETGFGPLPASKFFTSIGGTTNSSVYYSLYSGTGLFSLGNQLTNQGPFTGIPGGGSFGGSLGGGDSSALFAAASDFSLTQHLVIQTSAGANNTGFTATLSAAPVPEGGTTLSMLGVAFGAICGVSQFRRRRAAVPA